MLWTFREITTIQLQQKTLSWAENVAGLDAFVKFGKLEQHVLIYALLAEKLHHSSFTTPGTECGSHAVQQRWSQRMATIAMGSTC